MNTNVFVKIITNIAIIIIASHIAFQNANNYKSAIGNILIFVAAQLLVLLSGVQIAIIFNLGKDE